MAQREQHGNRENKKPKHKKAAHPASAAAAPRGEATLQEIAKDRRPEAAPVRRDH